MNPPAEEKTEIMKHSTPAITEISQGDGRSPSLTDEFEPLLDSDEAAALLKIHPKKLKKLARLGEIAGIQIGRLWRFRASALNRWLESISE